jgi:chromosome segregation ATPase
MSNGAAQWRNGQKKLAAEVNLLRHIQRIYDEKDVLRKELQQSKRTVKLMKQTNAELRRPQSSMSMRMSEYEREGMVRLLTAGAVERGEFEAEIEFQKMKVRQLETEVEFQKAKVFELETEIELGGEMEWNMQEWKKTYKALVMPLRPNKNGSAGADDNKTKTFKVVSSLNKFYTGKSCDSFE